VQRSSRIDDSLIPTLPPGGVVDLDVRPAEHAEGIAAPRQAQYRWKQSFDIAVAAILLVILSPLLAAIAVAIAVTTGGPILYRQRRLMQGRRQFTLYKFRSMVAGADERIDEVFHLNHANGPFFKAQTDPRVTPIGKLLRSFFLDELPQLVNVLRGEMSLVGPRPCLPSEAEKMGDRAVVDFRFTVPQGLTGPWQTNGHHALTLEEMLAVERDYIERWSFRNDLLILIRTLPLIVRRRGI
jgi:lipopolysaccharide/colanic/teichoic acid biosynthesis glycosyltransferase